MRNPFKNNSRIRKLALKINPWLQAWWIKYVVLPVLQAVPGVGLFATLRVKNADTLSGWTKELYEWGTTNPYTAAAIVAGYTILLNAFVSGVRRLAAGAQTIEIKDLLTLFDVIERTVGPKSARFAKYAAKIREGEKMFDSAETFETITQPDQQIALLNIGVQSFFDSLDGGKANISAAIAKLDSDERPVGWYHFHPDSRPPLVDASDLQSPDTTLSHAIETKRIVIVEDIRAEGAKREGVRRYKGVGDASEEGSLICYPILNPRSNSVSYVLSLEADRKRYFRERHKEFYSWVLCRFEVRIRLEHSLLELRKHAEES